MELIRLARAAEVFIAPAEELDVDALGEPVNGRPFGSIGETVAPSGGSVSFSRPFGGGPGADGGGDFGRAPAADHFRRGSGGTRPNRADTPDGRRGGGGRWMRGSFQMPFAARGGGEQAPGATFEPRRGREPSASRGRGSRGRGSASEGLEHGARGRGRVPAESPGPEQRPARGRARGPIGMGGFARPFAPARQEAPMAPGRGTAPRRGRGSAARGGGHAAAGASSGAASTLNALWVKVPRPDINTRAFLYPHFSQFGKVESVSIERNFAIVKFGAYAEAMSALKHGAATDDPNTVLRLAWAKPRKEDGALSPTADAGMTTRDEEEAEEPAVLETEEDEADLQDVGEEEAVEEAEVEEDPQEDYAEGEGEEELEEPIDEREAEAQPEADYAEEVAAPAASLRGMRRTIRNSPPRGPLQPDLGAQFAVQDDAEAAPPQRPRLPILSRIRFPDRPADDSPALAPTVSFRRTIRNEPTPQIEEVEAEPEQERAPDQEQEPEPTPAGDLDAPLSTGAKARALGRRSAKAPGAPTKGLSLMDRLRAKRTGKHAARVVPIVEEPEEPEGTTNQLEPEPELQREVVEEEDEEKPEAEVEAEGDAAAEPEEDAEADAGAGADEEAEAQAPEPEPAPPRTMPLPAPVKPVPVRRAPAHAAAAAGSGVWKEQLDAARARFKERYAHFHEELRSARLRAGTPSAGVVGQCMDMCAESERLEREMNKDLSRYEMVPGTEHFSGRGQNPRVQHEWAVKKYHRPTVDLAGDTPSYQRPEEVRPPEVLLRTMEYLTQLLDRKADEFVDLEKFVRDRTRAIRQDFVLQRTLADDLEVEVVERVCRFHIMADHRLCEEDVSNFDPSMNLEQLNKSLITLAQLYVDHNKAGHHFPTEGEFRAYFILTHMDSPVDTMSMLLSLRKEVYASPEVQIALEASTCVRLRDYVGFFKAVRNAPYLIACLLHRQFPRVHAEALLIMNAVYQRAQVVPLRELVSLLALEDEREAADLCAYYGLPLQLTQQNESGVVFGRDSFVKPKTPPRMRVAHRAIETKARGVSMADIVELPSALYLALVPPATEPEQEISTPVAVVEAVDQGAARKAAEALKKKKQAEAEQARRDARAKREEVLRQAEAKLAKAAEAAKVPEPAPAAPPAAIPKPVAAPPKIPAFASPAPGPVAPALAPPGPPVKLAPSPAKPAKALSINTEFIPLPMVAPRAPEPPRSEAAPLIPSSLLPSPPPKPSREEQQRQRVQDWARRRERRLTADAFRNWRQFVAAARRERERLALEKARRAEDYRQALAAVKPRLGGPSLVQWALPSHLRKAAPRAGPIAAFPVRKNAPELAGTHGRQVEDEEQLLALWEPLDVPRIIYGALHEQNPDRRQLYWKAAVLLEPSPTLQVHWLEAKLRKGAAESAADGSPTETLTLAAWEAPGLGHGSPFSTRRARPPLGLSIVRLKEVAAPPPPALRSAIQGAQALLVVLPLYDDSGLSPAAYWEQQAALLRRTAGALPDGARVPLLVLAFRSDAFGLHPHAPAEWLLALRDLPCSGFRVVWLSSALAAYPPGDHRSNDALLASGLAWLAACSPPQPQPARLSLKDLVELYVERSLERLLALSQRPGGAAMPLQSYVAGYAQALELLASDLAANDDALRDHPWPPPDLQGLLDGPAEEGTAPDERWQAALESIRLPEPRPGSSLQDYAGLLVAQLGDDLLFPLHQRLLHLARAGADDLDWARLFSELYACQLYRLDRLAPPVTVPSLRGLSAFQPRLPPVHYSLHIEEDAELDAPSESRKRRLLDESPASSHAGDSDEEGAARAGQRRKADPSSSLPPSPPRSHHGPGSSTATDAVMSDIRAEQEASADFVSRLRSWRGEDELLGV